MMPKRSALLVGNGINRLFGDGSWEEWIKSGKAMKRDGGVSWSQISNLPATMQIVVATDADVRGFVREKATELDAATVSGEKAAFLRDMIAMPVDCFLTTNYTFEIERAAGFSGSRKTYARKLIRTIETEGTQDDFRLFRYYPLPTGNGETKPLWHIHGDLAKIDSMILGHYYYAKHLTHIQKRAYQALRSCLGCQKHDREFLPQSWVDWFLVSDIHIVGFGMYACEMDLWWLLAYKSRHFSDTQVFYYGDCSQENRLLLQAYGVKIMKTNDSILHEYRKRCYDDAFCSIRNA